MQLSSISLAVTRASGQHADDALRAALWPLGTEPGLWIDPSTTSASYQDSVGRTPISAIGTLADASNPVGLILDRKYGLALGPEVWSAPGTPFNSTLTNGGNLPTLATSVGVVNFGLIKNATTTPGKRYQYTASWTGNVNGKSVRIDDGSGVFGVSAAVNGTLTVRGVATSGDIYVYIEGGAPSETFTITDISVREIPGLHLSQATSTARPLASARKNLLTKTEDFADAVWTKNNVVVAGAPGAQTLSSTAGQACYCVQYKLLALSTQYVARAVAVAGTVENLIFILDLGAGETFVQFNLRTLVVSGTLAAQGTATLNADGSVNCTITFTTNASGVPQAMGFYIDVYGNASTSGSLTIKSTQLERGALATAYQRVNTDADYNAAGFPIYDKFDGVDDALLSATVAAGVVGNASMDCLIAVRRENPSTTPVLFCEVSGNIGKFFGYFYPGATDQSAAGIGASSTTWVDSVQLAGGGAVQAGTLDTAMITGVWHILEYRNVDLSAWTRLLLSDFSGITHLNGGIGGIMIFPAASAANRDKARTALAAKVGLIL